MGDLSVPSESASRPGLPSSLAWWYFAVGSALAILSIAVPSATLRTASYMAVIVTLVPAAVIGARRNRASGAVWKFAAAMAVFFLITEVAASLRTPDRAMLGAHLFEDLARTAGELLYVGVLVAIVRVRRGRNVGSMLADATIVACGAWIVCYVTLIDPTLERSTQPALNTFIQGLYQPIGVAVVFMLAVVIFAETFRPVSMWFLATAILGALLGDLGYALEAAGQIGDGWLVVADSGYIIAYVSAGAMFLHPSVRSLTEPIPVGRWRPTTNRMLITTASLILPIAVLVVSEARTNVDVMVRLVSGIALCVAVIVRVASAISANERAQRALLLTAEHDALTGLPNRALLGEQITEALHDAWREDVRPTVLFIDVDRFKNINDSLGHAVGDQVLRLLGRRLRAAVPPHVRIGRISGDEFMALDATVRTMGEALAFADLVLSVFHEPIHVGSGDMYITASIGVAVAKTNGSVSAEELHRNADIAMYRAKDAGRNCVALFDDSMHERVAQRLQIESALHTALDRRELDDVLPTDRRPRDRRGARLRSADALAPCGWPPGVAGRVHPDRRGDRVDRADRRVGTARGADAAQSVDRRRSVPSGVLDVGEPLTPSTARPEPALRRRRGALPIQRARLAAVARGHRGRHDQRAGGGAHDHATHPCTGRTPGDRRFRHGLQLAEHDASLPPAADEDRPRLRLRFRRRRQRPLARAHDRCHGRRARARCRRRGRREHGATAACSARSVAGRRRAS